MKIFHVAPYGPATCGIYEAARDMIKADVVAGHEVYLVDKGYIKDGKQEYYPIGTVDDRGGFKIVTSNPKDIDSADLIIAHTMPPNEWIARNQVPIVFIVHGRPLYSFRLEQNSTVGVVSYTYINDLSRWPRIKKMVYFWPEFTPFWNIFAEGKCAELQYPIIDQVRFSPEGKTHVLSEKDKGDFNILICDSWREDVDMFEIVNGAIQAARDNRDKNIKFHIYAVETKEGKIRPCWDLLFVELDKLGAKGEVCGRMLNMETTFRAMDAILTPHRIIVRTIGEALSCGIPVIASEGCDVAQFHCDPHDPYSVSKAITQFVNSDQTQNKKDALEQSKHFHMSVYSKEMNKIYEEVVKGKK